MTGEAMVESPEVGRRAARGGARRAGGRAAAASQPKRRPRAQSTLGCCAFHGRECRLEKELLGRKVCSEGFTRVRNHLAQVKKVNDQQWRANKFDWIHRPAQWRSDNSHLLIPDDAPNGGHMARARTSTRLHAFPPPPHHCHTHEVP